MENIQGFKAVCEKRAKGFKAFLRRWAVSEKGRLNRKQKRFFEILKNTGVEAGITELCGMAGINMAEFYDWLKDDMFRAEFGRCIEIFCAAETGVIWGALMEQCRKGNIQAIKLFFDMQSKNRQSRNTAVNIIDDISPNEKE